MMIALCAGTSRWSSAGITFWTWGGIGSQAKASLEAPSSASIVRRVIVVAPIEG
jgi:hypothetical protein